jgi:hypothetical protein
MKHFSAYDIASLLDPAEAHHAAELAIIECQATVSRLMQRVPPADRRDVTEYLEAARASARYEHEQAVATIRSTHAMRDEDDQATLDDVLFDMTRAQAAASEER